MGVSHGAYQALLDAELYLPESWHVDRERCQQAGIPDAVIYQPKWRIALDLYFRLHRNGIHFDWLTFDEGYGSKVPFLSLLTMVGQKFVAEVPVSFSVRRRRNGPAQRADTLLTTTMATRGRRHRLKRATTHHQIWRVTSRVIWVEGDPYILMAAIYEATGEVKYLVTNATTATERRVLEVAFRRATIEHAFRLAKQEVGLMHYEGRQYTGLIRHLILALIVMGFVSSHTERLRGEKSAGNAGASVPGVECAVCDGVSPSAGCECDSPGGTGDSISPASQRPGDRLPPEAAA